MAKKKRKPDRKKAPRRAQPPTELPSREAMEAVMRELLAGFPMNFFRRPACYQPLRLQLSPLGP
jgi:hypothetical protein